MSGIIMLHGGVLLYEKCRDCHLLIDENDAHTEGDDDYAPYIHLIRGDDTDNELDGSHEPQPSGMLATLSVWQQYGPVEMRKRFTTRNGG